MFLLTSGNNNGEYKNGDIYVHGYTASLDDQR